jgi:hypothetical protein
MFDLTKREILTIVGALVVICGLTSWGTVFVIKKYVIADRDDPLARAGGLTPARQVK